MQHWHDRHGGGYRAEYHIQPGMQFVPGQYPQRRPVVTDATCYVGLPTTLAQMGPRQIECERQIPCDKLENRYWQWRPRGQKELDVNKYKTRYY